jgi:hypothetical protein
MDQITKLPSHIIDHIYKMKHKLELRECLTGFYNNDTIHESYIEGYIGKLPKQMLCRTMNVWYYREYDSVRIKRVADPLHEYIRDVFSQTREGFHNNESNCRVYHSNGTWTPYNDFEYNIHFYRPSERDGSRDFSDRCISSIMLQQIYRATKEKLMEMCEENRVKVYKSWKRDRMISSLIAIV